MYAPLKVYNLQVPKLQHYCGLNHLHYLTKSTYKRARLYDSERFRNRWVVTLEDSRRELGFKIIGYVLMSEHFHALIWPTAQANPSQVMQKLEDRWTLCREASAMDALRGAYIATKSVGTYAPPALPQECDCNPCRDGPSPLQGINANEEISG
jgi:REP element-mobilizing transposase RayT